MDCFNKFKCRGMCCYDGVYLQPSDVKRINECMKKYPTLFKDKDYIEISNWKNYKGLIKTKAVKLTEKRNDYPKHFSQTRCFFQNELSGKCVLQEIAIKNNEDKWKYKPLTCCGFPLRKVDGNIKILKIKKDDPNIFPDYDGYESCLPCFQKINLKELEEEINFLREQQQKEKMR